ncbi:hypothetical protein EES46_23340 [Streptomyces sp. ADI98-10]|nr:hypothetical protein EES46_23340 [Streptomyces sp. ADI98-10]
MISEEYVIADEAVARLADLFARLGVESRAEVLLASTSPVGESGFPE